MPTPRPDMEPPRSFAVAPSGDVTELLGTNAIMGHMGASPALIAGMDVLDDAGALTESRLDLLLACERGGKDPEAFARHLLTLIRAVRRPL